MPLYNRPAPGPFMASSALYQSGSAVTAVGSTALATSGAWSAIVMDVGPVSRAYDRMAVNVVTAVAGGTTPVLRLGVYADDGSYGKPGALLTDAGSVPITATGVQTITVSLTLAPGRYWLAACYTFAAAPTTSPSLTTVSTALAVPGTAVNTAYRGYALTGVAAGALPASAASAVTSSSTALVAVYLRAV